MRELNLENELPGPMDFEEEPVKNSEEVTAEKQTVSIELMVAKLMLNLKAYHNATHESLNFRK
jgi:sortase (surface protein transpeptidase)